MKLLENPFDVFVHRHVGTLESEVAEIFCGAETAGKNDSRKTRRNEFVERLDGRTGNPGRLGQNASDLIHGFAYLVIDDVSLKSCKKKIVFNLNLLLDL